MAETIHPFDPVVPQAEVDRLWRKLRDTRLPAHPIVPDAGEDYGPPLEWVHKLHSIWSTSYSWTAAQARIARWPHFTTQLEGLTVHFVHVRAAPKEEQEQERRPAIPLLLVHGWPGSFYEFSRVIDALVDPQDGRSQAFDVVVPSMPGFAWSSGPPRGWTLQDTARVFDALMRRLGYARYAAQAGDWGHWVVRELGARYSASCRALHTNMCPSVAPAPRAQWTAREREAQGMTDWFLGEPKHEAHMAYAIAMRTRPQTIGIAFCDNPVGIMMFVGEKYHELVDPQYRDLGDERFVDDLLTTVCLYYFTSPSIMTSMLSYYNNVRHEDYVEFNTRPENLIKAPFGFSSFRYDISPVSERAAATTGNLQWFREHASGGHFAALEMPDDFVKDVRECFVKLFPSTDDAA